MIMRLNNLFIILKATFIFAYISFPQKIEGKLYILNPVNPIPSFFASLKSKTLVRINNEINFKFDERKFSSRE